MNVMTRIYIGICILLLSQSLIGQKVSEQEAIQRALELHPSILIAESESRKSEALERTAFNPDQPQFLLELPTDAGPGIEIEQEIDFPTVYARRSDWLKSKTRLANENIIIQKRTIVRDVRNAYLDVQVAAHRLKFATMQDSIWNQIAVKSERLFEGGEINKGDLVFAQSRAGLINVSVLNARLEMMNSITELNTFFNSSVAEVDELKPLAYTVMDTTDTFYFENFYSSTRNVALNEMNVIKAQRLPGIIIGYLREPEPETDFRHRIRAGITVPIWQAQYKGEIEASKIEAEQVDYERDLRLKESKAMLVYWNNTLNQTNSNLKWFEERGIPQRDELTSIYMRLFDAGEVDYAMTLRNIADAFEINDQYIETIELHNRAVINLQYLKGTNTYE